MNILIVSQNFTRGGLETQIYTQYTTMKNENNFSFAFKNYSSKLDLSGAKIYTDFNFSWDSSIEEFCNDVENLVEIIKNDKIDIIHAHPFYSVFPAVFAAKIMQIPIVYTYHGVLSLNFTNQINDNILFKAMLESEIDKVFSVSKTGIHSMSNIVNNSNKLVFFPNAIDLTKYKKNVVVNNKSWALISRIDADKVLEIKKIISAMDEVDIEKICIYGDGDKKNELEQFISDNGLCNKVILMGHCDSICDELNGKYNGVLGTSRVAMEAIAMGYPIILVGYGKITGIIDLEMYNLIKEENFINKTLQDIPIDKLKLQIQNVYAEKDSREKLYEIFSKDYSASELYKKYKQEIENTKVMSSYDILRIYNEIKDLIETSLNEKIYSSRVVYNILKKYIQSETTSYFLKDEFQKYDMSFNQQDLYYNIVNEIEQLKGSIEKQNENIEKNYNSMIEIIENQNKVFSEQLQGLNENINFIKEEQANLENEINAIREEQSNLQDKINIKFLAKNSWKIAKNKLKK